MIKFENGKALIECEFFTRPGVKKAHEKTVRYKRSTEAKQKVDQYSGQLKVSAEFERFGFGLSAAVSNKWYDLHSYFISTEKEEYVSKESCVEYYDNVTLLVRSITFRYYIDGSFIEHLEETVVQNVKGCYSLEQLTAEAKRYMKETYGVDDSIIFQVPLDFEKNIYITWKPFNIWDNVPNDAVYAGNVKDYSAVYVGRCNNFPGLISTGHHKLNHGWMRIGYKNEKIASGEILLTNGRCEWVEIRSGEIIPENAVCSGKAVWKDGNKDGNRMWVGKTLIGEPGILREGPDKESMLDLIGFYIDPKDHCYVLTIKNVYWKSFDKSDPIPKGAVYAGKTENNNYNYIARCDNTPGFVGTHSGKLNHFWVHGLNRRNSGEILFTNGRCGWVKIKRGEKFPDNAVYSGIDRMNNPVWIGRSLTGEAGAVTSQNGNRMQSIWCINLGELDTCCILTIS